MNTFKFHLLAFTTTFLLGTTVAPVFAQPQNSTRSAVKSDQRCEAILKNVDKRLEQFDANKDGHVVRYDALKAKIARLVSKFDSQGLDTTKLKADLKVLDDKMTKAHDDYKIFLDELRTAKTYQCGASQGQFKSSLVNARNQLKTAQGDWKDVREYFRTVIKPDLEALRAQISPEPSPTTAP